MRPKQLGADSKNDLVTAINRHYDKIMFMPRAHERHRGGDFCNFGYWDQATATPREACENLMEKLLAFIPEKEGAILDVACGKGATSRYLLKYYNPKDVTGINISEKQLERCRVNAPGCNFFLMNATKLAFPDESFNNIICVEAAFHFNTREKFLHEASRVLKPGGRLVLSDILRRYQAVHKPLEPELSWQVLGVAENYVRDLRQYRNLCFNAGFEQVEITDATFECWVSRHRYGLRFLRNQFHSGKIDRPTFIRRQRRNKRSQTRAYYVLLSARKADTKSDLVTAINRHYDKIMFMPRAHERFQGSDFFNFGYWDQATATPKEACENLMEKLLAFIPEKEGAILDVACGKGATSRYLLKYYNPKDVTGINISEKQLERCRVNAPGCNFFLMNATKLAFPDESFNNIICVEAAFHFNTREKFLHEASRVLKPGGCLVLADILPRYQAVRIPLGVAENYVSDLRQYRNLCFNAGFEHVEITDATFECWVSRHRYALRFLRNQLHSGKIDRPTFIWRRRLSIRRSKRNQTEAYYVLVSARKAD